MPAGTGCMLYRRAFCLFCKALYRFQLQTPETAVSLEQTQLRGRGSFPGSSLAISPPLWDYSAEVSAREEQESGVEGH